MQDYVFTLAGALVGFCVGLTGVGGGSLMTPMLLGLGVPPATAIGTDLLYASITKSGGALIHANKRTINWRVVGLLSAGSLPLSLATVWALRTFFHDSNEYKSILTTSLGFMLMLTALSLIFKPQLQAFHNANPRKNELRDYIDQRSTLFTVLMGAVLGLLVTLSSVGAGAFGVMVLLVLYPRLATIGIIGTDVTHAVVLTLIAGLGHLSMGNVDFSLLGKLLIGSLPAIYIGTHLSARLPERVIQPLLGLTLGALSVKFMFY